MSSGLTYMDQVSVTVLPFTVASAFTVMVLPAASAMNDFHLRTDHSTSVPLMLMEREPIVKVVTALPMPVIA